MTRYNWHNLMTKWNTAILSSNYRKYLTPKTIENNWLGKPGATPAQIEQLEQRIRKALPKSYREFLVFSNGWGMTAPYIYQIWSTGDVDWFYKNNQGWIDAYTDQVSVAEETDFIAALDMNTIERNTEGVGKLNTDHLQTALEISEVGDAAIYLLNPQVVAEDGEWEAWLFADWLPGARRYPSFWEMMVAEYRHFLERQGKRMFANI
jgi:hypothetical protein